MDESMWSFSWIEQIFLEGIYDIFFFGFMIFVIICYVAYSYDVCLMYCCHNCLPWYDRLKVIVTLSIWCKRITRPKEDKYDYADYKVMLGENGSTGSL